MKINKHMVTILMAGIVMLLMLVKMPLIASAQTNTTNNAIGVIDNPANGNTLSGTQNIYGWFLDSSGVTKIEVLIDGLVIGQATYGDKRPDVQKNFPLYKNGTAGFHYSLNTNQFKDGQHTLAIRETGKSGRVTTLPNRTITIQNAFGNLDNPASGVTLKGTQNVYGWFLDTSNVAKIDVLVDGTMAGQAIYGDARPDVQKFFPQFKNGNSGFHYRLDTTRYTDG
jgi:N-acetylmuramoyl-L-alanine amidase